MSLSVEQMLETAAKAGFDGFELLVGEGEIDQVRRPSGLETLSRRAGEGGLELHSVSTVLHWKYPLSSPDEKCPSESS